MKLLIIALAEETSINLNTLRNWSNPLLYSLRTFMHELAYNIHSPMPHATH